MRPVIGARFTCTSKTLMKMETRCSGSAPRPSSGGGRKKPMEQTTPSAGDDHEPLAQRREALRIAEEIDAPAGGDEADPAERRGDPMQQQGGDGEGGDEDIAFRMDRDERFADRFEDRHGKRLRSLGLRSAAGGARLSGISRRESHGRASCVLPSRLPMRAKSRQIGAADAGRGGRAPREETMHDKIRNGSALAIAAVSLALAGAVATTAQRRPPAACNASAPTPARARATATAPRTPAKA